MCEKRAPRSLLLSGVEPSPPDERPLPDVQPMTQRSLSLSLCRFCIADARADGTGGALFSRANQSRVKNQQVLGVGVGVGVGVDADAGTRHISTPDGRIESGLGIFIFRAAPVRVVCAVKSARCGAIFTSFVI